MSWWCASRKRRWIVFCGLRWICWLWAIGSSVERDTSVGSACNLVSFRSINDILRSAIDQSICRNQIGHDCHAAGAPIAVDAARISVPFGFSFAGLVYLPAGQNGGSETQGNRFDSLFAWERRVVSPVVRNSIASSLGDLC